MYSRSYGQCMVDQEAMSVYLCVYVPIYVSMFLCMYVSICLCMYLYIYVSLYLSIIYPYCFPLREREI